MLSMCGLRSYTNVYTRTPINFVVYHDKLIKTTPSIEIKVNSSKWLVII